MLVRSREFEEKREIFVCRELRNLRNLRNLRYYNENTNMPSLKQ